MTTYNLNYSGIINKVEFREAAGKKLVEVSLCKKDSKKDAEEHYTWIRVTIWTPPDWMAEKLLKGNFIVGNGPMTTRSFEGKDGVKKTSIEVKSDSFSVDVMVMNGDAPAPRQAAPQKPIKPDHAKAAAADDENLPF